MSLMWPQKHWKDPHVIENNLSSLDNRKEAVTVKFRTLILVKLKGKKHSGKGNSELSFIDYLVLSQFQVNS